MRGAANTLRGMLLLAFAGFVWLRPAVKPPGPVSLLYVAMMAALALAAYLLIRYPPIAVRVERVLTRATAVEAAGLALLAVILAIPAIATPIVTHWDVSGWMDSRSYDVFAMNISTGKVLAGHSSYMPVYQYGLASIYFVFGHFFFVQQVVNALLALTGVVLIVVAAWRLFDFSGAAALVTGVLYAHTPQFWAAIQTTQIETWYVPMVCAVLLAWAVYWRRPSTSHAVWLAIAIGLALNTRNQGVLMLAVIAAAPVLRPSLAMGTRLGHLAVVGALALASLVPWTLRNAAVDGRWSPFADRSAMYVGIYTDPRVGLYGIRYWEGWDDVAAEFQSRYPDAAEREKAYVEAAWNNVTRDPGRSARALVWRALSFYGLLPDGYLLLDRIEPPDWRDEWRRYVFSRGTPLLLLPLTLLALVMRPTAPALVLSAAAAAGLAVVIASAPTEDRLSYPLFPVHILVIASLFVATPAVVKATAGRVWMPSRRAIVVGLLTVVTLAVVIRLTVGARQAYRPLMETNLGIRAAITVDDSLPLVPVDLNRAPAEGARARALIMVSNYMCPPKYAGPVPSVPAFASDPSGPQYFYGYLVTADARPQIGSPVGVTFSGAELSEPLREGDVAEVEAMVAHRSDALGVWLRVERARKLAVARASTPAFP